jgi:hypothetical protein
VRIGQWKFTLSSGFSSTFSLGTISAQQEPTHVEGIRQKSSSARNADGQLKTLEISLVENPQ